jgi:phage terminase large subunit-like protein
VPGSTNGTRSRCAGPAITPRQPEKRYRFSVAAARRILLFVEKYATHGKGELAGQPIALERWQKLYLVRLFGWRRGNGTRRYRKSFLAIGRKNGKTTLVAILALYLTCYDDEPGAEVYSAAGDREQARLMFDVARDMVRQSPELSKRMETFRNSITYKNSSYKVASADAKLKHGTSPHGVLFDELHVQPSDDLYEAFATGMGARRQPLMVMITTAGVFDPESLCWREWQYARKVLDGVIADDEYLPVIYEAGPEDPWDDPAVWAKANPNLGVSIKLEYLEAECRKAKEDPSYENTFRRLYLNQWTQQTTRWMQMERWDACNAPVDLEALKGERCYVGMDLSATVDVTALVLVFPRPDGTYDVVPRFWIPSESMDLRVRRDRVPYDVWEKHGLVTATDGNAVDHEAVRQAVLELATIYKIEQVAFDPWNAHKLVVELMQDGLPMVECRQGFITLSAPTKDLMTKVIEKRMRHGGHAVLRWMASNVESKDDEKGNIRLVKPKRNGPGKIDGIQALVMALWAANKHESTGPSVYESRGLLFL